VVDDARLSQVKKRLPGVVTRRFAASGAGRIMRASQKGRSEDGGRKVSLDSRIAKLAK
jgi:hypothetical protein